MQKILLLFSFLALFVFNIQAQAPQAFQYQAVARGSNGLPLISQNVSLRVSIISGSPTGSILYVETHAPTTNQFGLFTLPIGQGTIANGTFSSINWGTNSHYIKVEMDETGGFAYQDMGTVQLLSVPYALHAGSASNTNDPDPDPTNELQTLSIVGQDLTISGGNTVTLPNGSTVQVLSKVSNTISLSGGGGSVTLNDDDPANEIQSLSLVGTTLSISSGNSVTLSSGGGTLDAAYDFGGAGAGRIINADNGPVEIIGSGTNKSILITNTNAANTSEALNLTTNAPNAFGINVENTAVAGGGTGHSIRAITSQNLSVAVQGGNFNTTGTGIVGYGNNGSPSTLAAGAGGAFIGDVNGGFTYATTNGAGQSLYALLSAGFPSAVRVNYWNGSTQYKIQGTGTVSCVVPDLDGNKVTMHAPETPEFYYMDYGQGQLVNGFVHIDIDPVFAKNICVNSKHPLRVYVQLEGDCNGVFVTNKTATGFDVKELNGGTSNVSFQYNIVANAADLELGNGKVSKFADLRFEPAAPLLETVDLGVKSK